MAPEIALSWQLGSNFGWGLFGLQIALQLTMMGRARPILLSQMLPFLGDPEVRARLDELWAYKRGLVELMQSNRKAETAVSVQVPVITALGNNAQRQFVYPRFVYRGTWNHGLVFLENPLISARALEEFNRFDTLTAGSTWAAEVLRARGMPSTQVCIQGIDPTLFHPRPFDENSRDRFVIFSGGKLEFRKGQDIVLEAVRRFRERHPETLLVCVWGNSWLDNPFVKLFEKSPYLSDILSFVGDQRVDWCGLIGAFGMTRNHAHVYDTVENRILPQMMRKADVALFPNRCEGGTNMMAMQAMACGVPCILSANSGHMDIIQDGACLPLRRQRGVVADYPELSTEGWGESDVDEIVDALELIHRDREKARVIGAAGAHLMARHTWEAQIRELAPMVGL